MKQIASLLLLIVTFVSCQKDDHTNHMKDHLMKHSWRYDSCYLNGVSLPIDSCQSDDIVKFISGGSYMCEQGVLKCDTTKPATVLGNWMLNGKTLEVTVPGDSLTYSIDKANDEKMEMRKQDTAGTYKFIFTPW